MSVSGGLSSQRRALAEIGDKSNAADIIAAAAMVMMVLDISILRLKYTDAFRVQYSDHDREKKLHGRRAFIYRRRFAGCGRPLIWSYLVPWPPVSWRSVRRLRHRAVPAPVLSMNPPGTWSALCHRVPDQ